MLFLLSGRQDTVLYTVGSTSVRQVACLNDDGTPVDLTVAGRKVYWYVGLGTNVFTTFLFRIPVVPDGTLGVYGIGTLTVPSTITTLASGTTYYAQAYVDDGTATGLSGISILTYGAGLNTAPSVGITDMTGSGASATAKVAAGPVASLLVTAPGSFTTPDVPALSIASANGDGAGAVGSVSMAATFQSCTVVNPGTYSNLPSVVQVTGGGSGGGAAFTPVFIGGVGRVLVGSGGTYSGTPTGWTVTFTGAGGTGSGATGEVDFLAGAITRVRVLEPGAGYQTPVTVTCTPIGATQTTAPTLTAQVIGGSWSCSAYQAATSSAAILFSANPQYFPAGTVSGSSTTNGPRLRLTFSASTGGVTGATVMNAGAVGTTWVLTITPNAAYGGTPAIITVVGSSTSPTITQAGSKLVATTASPVGALVKLGGTVPTGGLPAFAYIQALQYTVSSDYTVNGVGGSQFCAVELAGGFQAGCMLTTLPSSANFQLVYQGSSFTLDTNQVLLTTGTSFDANRYGQVQAVTVAAPGANYPVSGVGLTFSNAGVTVGGDAVSLQPFFTYTVLAATLSVVGAGYTTAPTCTLTPANGASVVANLSATMATITLGAAGANYQSPSVALTFPSTQPPTTAPTAVPVFARNSLGTVSQLMTLQAL